MSRSSWTKSSIRTLRDRLRSTANLVAIPLTAWLAQLAGAVPTQVEVPDIPTAFSTGRIDAMISSPTTGANTKAWDYVSYFYNTQAWLPKNLVTVNKDAFSQLDPADQEALLDAAKKAEERGWKASQAETEEQLKILKENGMTVVIPIDVVAPSEKLMTGLRQIGKTMTEVSCCNSPKK